MSDDLQEAPSLPEIPDNRPGEVALRVLQRTAAAISPWVRPWWGGEGHSTPVTSSAQTEGHVAGEQPLALRVQRSLNFAASPTGGGELTDRFSQSILQRHTTAEQIGRRYRNEPRRPSTPAPTQLPLPGVQGAGRVQRAPNEMSLDELARSMRSAPGMEAQPAIQREVDPRAEAGPNQPTTIADMQEAIRRAAELRSTSTAQAGNAGTVQRSLEGGESKGIVATIEERIRQARERNAGQGAPTSTAIPTPQSSPSSPPPVQRAPAPAGQPPSTGMSISAQIEARIRAARDRIEGTSSVATSSTPAPAPVQRAVETPFAAPTPVPEDVPRELPFPPSAEPSSPAFSKTAAIQRQIQQARELARLESHNPKPPPTAEEMQRKADPNSPDFSKAEAIRQRIDQARIQQKPMEFSPQPGDPHYSVAQDIRQRINNARAQRSGVEPRADAPSAPSPKSTPTPAQSFAQQVRDRIQAARDRATQPPPTGAPDNVQRTPEDRNTIVRDLQLKPSPVAGPNPPVQAKRVRALSRSQILTPERKTGDFLAGETPRPGVVSPTSSPSVQRAIDVVTPANVGSTEVPSTAAPLPATTPSDPQSGSGPATIQRSEVESPEVENEATLQSSPLTTPPVAPASPIPELRTAPLAEPTAIDAPAVQRSPEPSASAQPSVPALPVPPEALQRTPDATAESRSLPAPATESPTPPPLSSPIVQRVEATQPVTPSSPAAVAPDLMQRTPDETADGAPAPTAINQPPVVGTSQPQTSVQRTPELLATAPVATQTPEAAPASATQLSEPTPLQRSPEITSEDTTTPPVADEPAAPPTIQRSAETPSTPPATASAPIVVPGTPPSAEEVAQSSVPSSTTQPSVQRSIESLATPALTSTPPSTPLPATAERVQQTPDVHAEITPTTAAPSAPDTPLALAPASNPLPTVQRSVDAPPTPPALAHSTAPQRVQRTPEAANESSVASTSISEMPAPSTVQRSPDAPATPRATQPPSATPSAAPERVQRSVESRPEEALLPSETSERSEASSSPSVQRSPEISTAIPVVPPLGPEAVQRTPDTGVERVVSPSAAGEKPTIQRSVASPEPSEALPPASTPAVASTPISATAPSTTAPEQVQRSTPEATEHTIAPLATETQPVINTPPTQPSMQRTVETTAPSAAPSAVPSTPSPAPEPEQIQRTPAAPAASAPAMSTAPLTPPSVQRSEERSATTQAASQPAATAPSTPATSQSAPDRIQRTPERDSEAASSPAATSESPAVQRAPLPLTAAPAVTPSTYLPAQRPEVAQRTPDASTPVAPAAPPAQPTIQRTPDLSSETAAVSAAEPATSVPEVVQRKPDTDSEISQRAPSPSAPTASLTPAESPTVQRSAATPSTPAIPAAATPTTLEAVQRAPSQPAVQREVHSPAVTPTTPASTPTPEQVQQTPDLRAENVPGPSAGSEVPLRPTIQRDVQSPAVTPAVPAPTPAPEQVQRTPDVRAENRPAPSAATEATAQPVVQRSVESATVTPTVPAPTAAPDQVQRMPETRVENAPSPSVGSEAAAPATVQRSVSPDAHKPTVSTPMPSPEVVQRTEIAPSPSISNAAPAQPEAPSSEQTPTTPAAPATLPIASEAVQRTPEIPSESTPATPLTAQAPATEQRTVSAPTPTVTPPAPENVQRTPEAGPDRTTLPGPTSEPPSQPTIQRTPSPSAFSPTPTPPFTSPLPVTEGPTATPTLASFPSAPESIQRTVAAFDANAPTTTKEAPSAPITDAPAEVAPFRPINRYRDPRLLSRAFEPGLPLALAELPLNSYQPSAILPQARLSPFMPVAQPVVQRSVDQSRVDQSLDQIFSPHLHEFVQRKEVNSPTSGEKVINGVTRDIQRSPEKQAKPGKSSRQKAIRRTSSPTRSSTVQRATLPLAKLRTIGGNGVVQREGEKQEGSTVEDSRPKIGRHRRQSAKLLGDQDEGFVGTSISQSPRGNTTSEEVTGEPLEQGDESGEGDEDNAPGSCSDSKNGNEDLDRLATAILPVIKHMLAVERDRINPRPLL